MRSKFELIFIGITVFTLLVFFLVLGSIFFIIPFEGFINSLMSPELAFSIGMTIYTSLISAMLAMLFCIPIAYTLSRYKFPLKGLFKVVIDLPIALPEIVVGIVLLMFLGSNGIGTFLEAIGISFVFNVYGIIIAQFFIALPYAVRVLYSTFNYIDPHYEFVSRSLGYGETSTFLNITIPLAKNGLFATGIITVSRCIGTFASVLFVGGGMLKKTDTLSVSMYLNLSTGNIDAAITAGIILVVISLITITVMERYAKENFLV